MTNPNSYMGPVRLIRPEGVCQHYDTVQLVNMICHKCGFNFLGCPVCKPRHCPDCRAEKQKPLRLEEKPYYQVRHKQTGEQRQAYMREYRKKHREEINQQVREHYQDAKMEKMIE